MAAAAEGDRDDAIASLARAAQAFDDLGVAFEAARTREELAKLVTPDERRVLLQSSLEDYEQVGATPSAARVRAHLA